MDLAAGFTILILLVLEDMTLIAHHVMTNVVVNLAFLQYIIMGNLFHWMHQGHHTQLKHRGQRICYLIKLFHITKRTTQPTCLRCISFLKRLFQLLNGMGTRYHQFSVNLWCTVRAVRFCTAFYLTMYCCLVLWSRTFAHTYGHLFLLAPLVLLVIFHEVDFLKWFNVFCLMVWKPEKNGNASFHRTEMFQWVVSLFCIVTWKTVGHNSKFCYWFSLFLCTKDDYGFDVY